MFLAIRSTSRTNSVDMFTLGVSTARGTDKIGQFGSGSLMGVLLWLRAFGESPVFMLNGSKVSFYARPERMSDGKAFSRVYMVENGVTTPLSVSLDYGIKDWTDPIMALREWISNAIDQGADLTKSIDVVDAIDATESEVCVFVPFNGTCQKYWQDIHKYFLHFTGKEKVVVIEKDAISKCAVYRRGVLIRELDEQSIFDYNLDFDISESRNGSSDSMTYKISDVVMGSHFGKNLSEDQRKVVLRHVLNHANCIEIRLPSWREHLNDTWQSVISALPEGMRFSMPGISTENATAIDPKWYKMIAALCPNRDGLLSFGQAAKDGHVIVPTPPETTKLVNFIWGVIKGLGLDNGKEMPKVEVFKTKDGKPTNSLGYYSNGVVSIWLDQCSSKQTILEELCHHASGESDCTRSFQEYLFRLTTELIELTA